MVDVGVGRSVGVSVAVFVEVTVGRGVSVRVAVGVSVAVALGVEVSVGVSNGAGNTIVTGKGVSLGNRASDVRGLLTANVTAGGSSVESTRVAETSGSEARSTLLSSVSSASDVDIGRGVAVGCTTDWSAFRRSFFCC